MRIRGNVVEDDWLAAHPDLGAKRGLDLQFAARLQAESKPVAHCTGNPSVLRDSRDCGEAHSGDAAHDLENRPERRNSADFEKIGGRIVAHRATLDLPLHSTPVVAALSPRLKDNDQDEEVAATPHARRRGASEHKWASLDTFVIQAPD
jgi:hypothetical protein